MSAYDTHAKVVNQEISYALSDNSRKACHKHAVELNDDMLSKKKERKGKGRQQDPDYKNSLGSEITVMC